jgi:hypothetical protein
MSSAMMNQTTITRKRAGYSRAIDIDKLLSQVVTVDDRGICTFAEGWNDAEVASAVSQKVNDEISPRSVYILRTKRYGHLRGKQRKPSALTLVSSSPELTLSERMTVLEEGMSVLTALLRRMLAKQAD